MEQLKRTHNLLIHSQMLCSIVDCGNYNCTNVGKATRVQSESTCFKELYHESDLVIISHFHGVYSFDDVSTR